MEDVYSLSDVTAGKTNFDILFGFRKSASFVFQVNEL